MTAIEGIWGARAAGLLAGIALAAALLAAGRPAEGGSAVGAAVSAHADLNGELAVSPAGPASFLRAAALRPEAPASGSVEIRNQTGLRQRVRIRALGSSAAMDDTLSLRFEAGGAELRSGMLGELGRPGGDPVVLDPGESAAIATAASIPPGAPPDWEAALVDVALLFDLSPALGGGAGGR